MAIKISVINFKGGVGKTTLSFHLADHLANEPFFDGQNFRQRRVLLVDVDHQSSLSIVALGGNRWAQCVENRQTCNGIFESYCKQNVSMPGGEIISVPKDSLKFHLVAAQFELDDTEMDLASTTLGNTILSEWQKKTLLAQWFDYVGADEHYDYIIFDCPPATKLVSQNALVASDYFVIPVIPDEMSSRGVTHFINLVRNKIDLKLKKLRESAGLNFDEVPRSYVPDTKIAGIVPFMAKSARGGFINLHTRTINNLKDQWGSLMLETVVTHMAGIAESMDLGLPVWSSDANNAKQSVINMMKNVCNELKTRIKELEV